MKKRFILFLLSAIFVIAGIAVVGCQKNANMDQTFTTLEEVVRSVTTSDSPFVSGTINGVETDFLISNFKNKDAENQFVNDDQNYLLLTAVSMNYIYNYYGETKDLENKYNVNSLYKNANKLIEKYQEMKTCSNELNSLGDNAETFVYNGKFTKYKMSVRDFISQAYLTASSLGDVLINKVKITSNLGTANQTGEDLVKYLDYCYMMSFNDFSDFFMGSCKGQVIDSSLYITIKNKMITFAQDIVSKPNKELSADQAKELVTMSSAYAGERRMYEIAVSNFSLYDFTTRYECSIEAYAKDKNDIVAYHEEIERYYVISNSSYAIYYNYLKNNIKNLD